MLEIAVKIDQTLSLGYHLFTDISAKKPSLRYFLNIILVSTGVDKIFIQKVLHCRETM